MSENKYYSTGEVAKMFSISRSTVSRKFDEGVFWGKKNPITGERFISQHSIEEFAATYSIEIASKGGDFITIILSTVDSSFEALFRNLFKSMDKVKFSTYNNLCDLIVACTKTPPDMLFIDDSMPGIKSINLIVAVQKSLSRKDMTIIGIFDTEEDINNYKNLVDEARLKSMVDSTYIKNMVMSALRPIHLEDFKESNFTHRRMWRRVNVKIAAQIGIKNSELKDAPEEKVFAEIENICLGGAFLTNIEDPRLLFGGSKGTLKLLVNSQPLVEWEAFAKMVRFHSNDYFNIGVSFMKMTEKNEDKIIQLINTTI